MPLNPNGKIDKPALPFPDTAQVAPSEPRRAGPSATPTEEATRSIWNRILPNTPSPIPLDENFFDLGGHSILATRLIFEIRKAFVVEAPLGLVFDKPTIRGLAAAVDSLRNADFGLGGKEGDKTPATPGTPVPPPRGTIPGSALATALKRSTTRRLDYGKDYDNLVARLRPSYAGPPSDYSERPLTVFLTGATGFLGAFILRDLLQRNERVKKVICLVRASSEDKALERLRDAVGGRGVWDEEWVRALRVEVVKGDLDQEFFGLDKDVWGRVAEEADAIVHNGALVSACFLGITVALTWGPRALGPLGVSVRKAPISQRACNAHCY